MLSHYGNCFSLIELHQPFHCTDSLNACCRGNKFYSRFCTPACITTWISGYTCTWVCHSQVAHTYTQVNVAKRHIWPHTRGQLLWIIRMTRADWLKIHIFSRTLWWAALFTSLLWCILKLGWFPRGYVNKLNYPGITRTVQRSDISRPSSATLTPYIKPSERKNNDTKLPF